MNRPLVPSVKSSYINDSDGNGSLSSFKIIGSENAPVNEENRTDEFGRLTESGVYQGNSGEKRERAAVVSSFEYTNSAGCKTSNQVSGLNITGGTGENAFNYNYDYSYDATGNITHIYKDNELFARYEYDEAGQLIRADDAQQNKSFTYKYNAGGNIEVKREYAFTTGTLGTTTDTTEYTYDTTWKDKLVSYGSQSIQNYDASGNPLSYDGWAFSWQGGRQLAGMSKTGVGSIAFTYNQDGIRTGKTVGSVTTEYTVIGSKITHQKTGENNIYYFYDQNDSLVSLNYDGENYFYVKNLQGDIIAITDVDGNIAVEYTYDAWGKLLSATGSMASTLGIDNPFRYRGYFYDTETGLYYLQSRYYNPEWGRFINADAVEYIYGMSLFSYCCNSPVTNSDSTGYGTNDLNWRERILVNLLCKDEFAKQIVTHWIIGAGNDKNIDNTAWSEYLWKNKNIQQLIYNAIKNSLSKHNSTFNNISQGVYSVTLAGNGGYQTGYELLNGSNINYGGFKFKGTIYWHANKRYVDIYFEFHDRVDPNYNYSSDAKFYNYMKRFVLEKGHGVDYTIHIYCFKCIQY